MAIIVCGKISFFFQQQRADEARGTHNSAVLFGVAGVPAHLNGLLFLASNIYLALNTKKKARLASTCAARSALLRSSSDSLASSAGATSAVDPTTPAPTAMSKDST